MRFRAATIVFIGLTAVGAVAEEPAVPLENSREELKTLQQDQAAQKPAPADAKSGGTVPQFQAPQKEHSEFERLKRSRADLELKKKRAAQKNWLVDGVDQLEKNDRLKDRTAQPARIDAAAGAQTEKLDSSDPEYLLKLYNEQPKDGTTRAGAKQADAVRGDPFGPFLQGWLGSSPGRGMGFDGFVRKPEFNPAATATNGSPANGFSQEFNNRAAAASGRDVDASTRPNPYLQGLDLQSLQELGGNRAQAASPGQGIPAKPIDMTPAMQPAGATPSASPGGGKSPRLPLSDDKKYFPQLKKF